MATVSFTPDNTHRAGRTIVWAALTTTNADGSALEPLEFADISIQVLGTFGAGGTLLIEGSNEVTPTTWATLNDPQGNALSVTAAKIEQLLEVPRWIRPRVSAGDGTTSLTVNVWARRA
jgi:hypothetical protein